MAPSMHKIGLSIVLLLLSVAMTGCKIWIKRGAGPDQLSQDQAECRAQAGGVETGDAYLDCMRDRGWYFQDKSLQPLGSEAGSWLKPLPVEPSVSSPGKPPALQAEPPIERAAPSARPGAPRPAETESGVGQAAPPRVTESTSDPARGDADVAPRTEYNVGSWWKIGGSPDQLKQDQADCRSQLGSTGTSRTVQWTATPEFVRCMKDKGWYGFSE